MSLKDKLLSTCIWGFILWLVGYIAGIILFFLLPKQYIGLVIAPGATIFTLWVLVKKIKRPALMCYFGVGLAWTIMAILLDYIFLVKGLGAGMAYYKPDVFLYYILTFVLPPVVGYWKYRHKNKDTMLF